MISNSSPITLNYLADSVEHSLYRNGKVFIERDLNGNDVTATGVTQSARTINMHDARSVEKSAQPTLKRNGFELLDKPVITKDINFFDNQQVLQQYYPECAEIIKEATGAAQVLAFDHNVRSLSNNTAKKHLTGGQQVQPPIQFIHGDYTLYSAPQRLHDLTKPLGRNDTLRHLLDEGQALLSEDVVEQALNAANNGRFAIINLWRNIASTPVVSHPLGLCDGQTVKPEDLVVHEIHYADRIGENYFAKYAEQHEWYYYPHMMHDEALLIKQWDSAGEFALSDGKHADAGNNNEHCTFSFHTAFEDPETTEDTPERQSIEVRCIVLF